MTSAKNKKLHREIEDRFIACLKEIEEHDQDDIELANKWPYMTSQERLQARPIESDAMMIGSSFIEFEGFAGLLESWVWDGVAGVSIIILKEDRERFNSDIECSDYLFKQMTLVGAGTVTRKVSGRWFFVNFGFETVE